MRIVSHISPMSRPPAHAVRTTRTSVSLASPVFERGTRVGVRKGFRSFSDYVEYLLRLDQQTPVRK